MKRALVMLATEHHPLRFQTAGSFASEKLDGVRCLWLPETVGKLFTQIPFANREKDDREYACSGLWSRKGKPLMAPSWFTETLPKHPLDGELFIGRGQFQKTVSVVRKLDPVEDEWRKIKYYVFDIPSYQMVYKVGEINDGYNKWINACPPELKQGSYFTPRRFNDVYKQLQAVQADHLKVLDQKQLDSSTPRAEDQLMSMMKEVMAVGGEGVMLRRPHSIWQPHRSEDLAKVKELDTCTAKIVGFCYGTGKLTGMFGAVIVEWRGKQFQIGGGFTDRERTLLREYEPMASRNPGGTTAVAVAENFTPGQMINFEYNGVTDKGIPRFPRYRRS